MAFKFDFGRSLTDELDEDPLFDAGIINEKPIPEVQPNASVNFDAQASEIEFEYLVSVLFSLISTEAYTSILS